VSRVDEAGGLVIVDDLGELAMEEGVLDVKLASLLFKGKRDGEDDADRDQFDNRTGTSHRSQHLAPERNREAPSVLCSG
jgi:hypothetical protein